MLREHAGLNKNVVVVGAGDHVEIWDEEKWIAEQQKAADSDIASLLIELGF
jgi:MraZ protein